MTGMCFFALRAVIPTLVIPAKSIGDDACGDPGLNQSFLSLVAGVFRLSFLFECLYGIRIILCPAGCFLHKYFVV